MTHSTIFICHYSEIGLKGKNRNYFVKVLKSNIRKVLKRAFPEAVFRIEHVERRFIVFFEEAVEITLVYRNLSDVFGLANFTAVQQCAPEIEALEETTMALLADKQYNSFVVRSRRVHKILPYNSVEINRLVGAAVVERYDKKVSLKEPDLTCNIEVFKDKAFVSIDKRKGPGGMPVRTSGRVMVLMSGGFDSPVAASFAMKRGAQCEYIHFHTYPFTNKLSQEKVKDLVGQLNKFQFKSKLYMVPFTETQKEIVTVVPDKYRIVFYRRFMMRTAERLAQQRGIQAVVTGESLGQVASQTLENMAAVEQVITMPVLRPLIGMDKNEIMDIARRIGTYDISALPHDDACTRFMPHNPVIRARLDEVVEIEKALEVDSLVDRDLQEMEILEIPVRS